MRPTRRASHAGQFAAASLFSLLLLASRALATDEIHWTMTGPTSVTVDWRGSSSSLRYGLTTSYGKTATGVAPSPMPYSSAGPFWEAKITGLQAGSTYHYSVAGGPDHLFHGTPLPGSTFTVFAFADVGDSATYKTLAPMQDLLQNGSPSFALVPGDLTYAGDNGIAAVDQHFNDVMDWSLDAAYMAIWGNHEWDSTVDDMRNYKGRFDFPNAAASVGAPAAGCCGEDWYWFDAGNTRFIAYPEPYSGAWTEWKPKAKTLMDDAQANATIRFIVTFGHRPAYSSGYHVGTASLRTILDTLGVHHSKYVLNINGHSHDYERSKPQFGVTHITVGTGGASLEIVSTPGCIWGGGCPAPSWSAYRAMHHGSMRLTFGPNSIHGDMLCGPAAKQNDMSCAYGTVIDAFTIGSGGGDGPPLISGVPGNISAKTGQVLTVNLTTSDPDGDPISSLTANLTHLPPGNNAVFTPGSGNTSGRLTWTPSSSAVGSYAVSFRAANALADTASTVIDVTGTLDAPNAPAPRLALTDVRPNPVGSTFTLAYSLGEGDAPELEIVDVAGRVMQRFALDAPAAGRYTVQMNMPGTLRPGLYWLRLRQSGQTVAKRVVFRP